MLLLPHATYTVLVHSLNGLANMAAADRGTSDYLGSHGACEAVIAALGRRPRDLQLQAAGCKAVHALALGGDHKNLDALAMQDCPEAIMRAQGLFLRDREVRHLW